MLDHLVSGHWSPCTTFSGFAAEGWKLHDWVICSIDFPCQELVTQETREVPFTMTCSVDLQTFPFSFMSTRTAPSTNGVRRKSCVSFAANARGLGAM